MESKVIARAKKNFHDYRIIERLVAGLVLTGNEIKSLCNHQVSIGEAYVLPQQKELYVVNMNIAAYKYSHAGLSQIRNCSGSTSSQLKGDKSPKSDEICEKCKTFAKKSIGSEPTVLVLNSLKKKMRETALTVIKKKQEGLRREVLFWREYARSLEQRLSNQNNLTPQERQQSNYLRNLQRNTLNSAESNYKNKYGSLVEDKPKGSDNKDKGMSGGVIALMVIGGIILTNGEAEQLRRKVEELEREFNVWDDKDVVSKVVAKPPQFYRKQVFNSDEFGDG
ncbi:2692_t:CDS:2, partial [Scutellospora calospora]